jgi:ribose 5-phosphate isomerase A
LLQSQIDTLEEPDPGEDPLTVDAAAPAEQVADEIIRLLGASATVSQGAAAYLSDEPGMHWREST